MQPNLLDDFFKDHLKGKSNMPQGVTFRKEKVFNAVNERIANRSKQRHWVKYAVVLFLLMGSAFGHWVQQQEIAQQKQLLAESELLMEQLKSDVAIQYSGYQLKMDSITNLKEAMPKTGFVMSYLPSLPAVVTIHQLEIAPTISINIQEPIYITDQETPDHKSSVPELDLPVYYESERLASNTNEASKHRSFK